MDLPMFLQIYSHPILENACPMESKSVLTHFSIAGSQFINIYIFTLRDDEINLILPQTDYLYSYLAASLLKSVNGNQLDILQVIRSNNSQGRENWDISPLLSFQTRQLFAISKWQEKTDVDYYQIIKK